MARSRAGLLKIHRNQGSGEAGIVRLIQTLSACPARRRFENHLSFAFDKR